MATKPRCILVATHPRSGTHFCINSLCLNITGLRFSMVRGQYPTLERLLLPHDTRYLDEWEAYLDGNDGDIRLIKTHLPPTDIEQVLQSDGFLSPRAAALARTVTQDVPTVHVHRDGRDVMVSWFHYIKDGGGGLPTDLRPRLQYCTFSEFLRMPNKVYIPSRGFGPHDINRPLFWQHHVDDWLSHANTVHVSYEGLHGDFAPTVERVADALGLADRLRSSLQPPPFISRSSGGIGPRILRRLRLSLSSSRHKLTRNVRHYPPPAAWTRKGVVGDWKHYFTPEDKAFFMTEAGRMLKQLGYEAP